MMIYFVIPVNSVTNTRTIQQTPMFYGCTITNLNITINKWKCVKVSAFKTFEVTWPHHVFAYCHSLFKDVKYLSRDILCTEVSHKGKSCSIFLNQHNFICSKFDKLYNYNINILHSKTTGLWNNFNN
jgi:hypothetical protein